MEEETIEMEENVEQVSPEVMEEHTEHTEHTEHIQEHIQEQNDHNQENLEQNNEEIAPKFPCRWPECHVAEFSTELDMGLHVLATHLTLLQHGHFTLTRGLHGPEAPEAPEAPISTSPSTPSINRKRRRDPDEHQNQNVAHPQENVKMSEVAVKVIRRLMTPSRDGRLFQTDHFCILCQRNLSSPCTKKHNPAEVALVDEWKRSYGHLEPKKKAMLAQMRKLRDRYAREETLPRAIVKNEPKPHEDAPEDTQLIEEPEHHSPEDTQTAEELETNESEHTGIMRNPPKMSTLCTEIIERIKARGAGFRNHGDSEFCVICLSFKRCEVEHTDRERRLDNTWKKYFGGRVVNAEKLIGQLETFKGRYEQADN